MKVFKLPIPDEFVADCDNCHEMPARIRLLVGGNASEKLCSFCIGTMSMEIEQILIEIQEAIH